MYGCATSSRCRSPASTPIDRLARISSGAQRNKRVQVRHRPAVASPIACSVPSRPVKMPPQALPSSDPTPFMSRVGFRKTVTLCDSVVSRLVRHMLLRAVAGSPSTAICRHSCDWTLGYDPSIPSTAASKRSLPANG